MARDLLGFAGLVPLLPLAGAAVLLPFGRRIGEPRAGWLATGLLGAAFLWSCVLFGAMLSLDPDARLVHSVAFSWMQASFLHANVGFQADPLSITWCLIVTGVGSLIHLYSIGYMHGDPRFSRFFAYLNLFAGSMLLLVLADNFLLTFLGWEGVGLCSYLLISFWFERNGAAVAGKKAFVTNRVGDVGFLIAMFLIHATYGSLDYSAMGAATRTISTGTATAIALLLALAAVGKSAQVPLHVWLTDAMEGPTPVSALIHAATMVTAGIFLIARAHPFFEASGDAMTVVAWVGAITALLAGTVAVVQPDIKRVLAYSTISQLGYMFLGLGVGAYTAAVFMVIAHACYKGALFLGAGSVIHGNEGNQDLRIMGRFQRFLPVTAAACVVAWLSIAGIPPFSGFWSKDEILVSAFSGDHYALWAVGTIAAAVTAVYMTRLIFLTFFGNARFREAEHPPAMSVSGAAAHTEDPHEAGAGHGIDQDFEPTVVYGEPPRPRRLGDRLPHESPVVMLVPLVALALLGAVIGFVNVPLHGLEFLDEWLEPVFHTVAQPHPDSFVQGAVVEGVSVLFAVAGLAVALALYRRGLPAPDRDPLIERTEPVADILGHAYYYDDTITVVVGGPGERAATWLDRFFDQKVVDGAVNGTGYLVAWCGRQLRRVQAGLVRRYALAVLAGAAALLLYLSVWGGR